MKHIIKVFIVAMIVILAAVSVSAAVTTFELVPYNEANNQWEVTVHINLELDDTVTQSHVNTFAAYFYFNPEKLVLCDTSYNEITDYYSAGISPIYCYPVTSGRNQYSYTALPINTDGVSQMWLPQDNGMVRGYIIVNTTNEMFDSNDNLMFSVAYKLADGVTTEDLISSDFVVQQLFAEDTYTGTYGYEYEAATDYQMDCVNKVVPEAAVIKIPVLAGDKVYLADEVVEIAADGEYDVTDQVGKYVAVYTENGYAGTNANDEEMTVYQTTYYVDDTEAKEIHLNGVFESAYNTIRDRTPVFDKETNTTEDRNGIRFKFAHNPAGRDVAGHEIVEVGFIITAESQKVLNEYPDGYTLDAEMVSDGYAKFGKVFGDGRNTAMSSTDDDKWIMSATFYNIPITEAGVKTNIVSRPYYKVGDTYIYGEITKKSLRDAALAIKEAAGENYDTEYPEGTAFRDYIDEILYASGDLEVVEEIIIDVGGLYDALAALEAAA